MGEQPQLNVQRIVDADQLAAFLEALRHAGFGIDPQQTVAVHDVVLHLVARREANDAARVAGHIRPIVCRTPAEQAAFADHFAAWQTRILPGAANEPPPLPPARVAAADAAAAHIAGIGRTLRMGAGLLAIGLLVALVLLVRGLATPGTGILLLRSLPDSAQLWLLDAAPQDRPAAAGTRTDELGTTPREIRLAIGTHRVRIRRAGYADTVLDIRIGADTTRVEVALTRQRGRLALASAPAGATVLLDGAALGTTPLDTTANAGVHEVAYLLAGHVPRLDTVEVSADGSAGVPDTVTLVAHATTPVRVVTDPADATLAFTTVRPDWIASLGAAGSATVEQVVLGSMAGPLSLTAPMPAPADWRLPAGRYGLIARRAGFQDMELDLVVADSAVDRVVTLTPRRAVHVSVDAPATDRVTLDGTPIAADGSTILQGRFAMRWERPGFEPWTGEVRIAGDTVLRVPGALRRIREPLLRVAFTGVGDSLLAGMPYGDGPILRWRVGARAHADTLSPGGLQMIAARGSGGRALPEAADPGSAVPRHQHLASDVAVSPDGTLLAHADAAGGVTLWDAATYVDPLAVPLDTLADAARRFTVVRFAPDGRSVALGAEDGELLVRALVPVREQSFEAGGRTLAVSTDGSLVAAAGYGGDVVLRDFLRDTLLTIAPDTSTAEVTALAFTDAGELVVGRADGVLEQRSLDARAAPTPAWRLGQRIDWIRPNGDAMLHVARTDGRGFTLDPATLTLSSVAGSPDRLRVVAGAQVAHAIDRVILFGPPDDSSADTLGVAASPIERIAGSPRLVAAVSTARNAAPSFQVWHVGRRQELITDSADLHLPVADVAFSAGGTRLVTIDTAGVVTVWNPGVTRPFAAHASPVRDIAFTPVGSRIASAAGDSVFVRAVATGELLEAVTHAPGSAVEGIAFSPDGSAFASIAADSTVRVWRAGSRGATASALFRRGLDTPLLLALLAAAAGLAVLVFGWRRHARFFLVRRATDEEPPHLEHVRVQRADDALYDDMRFFRLALQLRRRTEDASQDLDVYATVRRMAAQGGRFAPVFRARRVTPEYLALVDRTTFADHQARFVDAMLDRLAAQEVLVARYTFDGDPRTCFAPGPFGRPHSLQTLAQLHPDHRLVLFGDARMLFDPVTGEREPWADQLLRWSWRALLTPEPRARWGRYENGLADSFVVGRLTVDGLGALAIGKNGASSDDPDDARFPDMLRRRPLRWIERDAPAESAVSEMLLAVRRYLGVEGWTWLAACAAYPALSWQLTLNLGHALRGPDGAPLLSPDRLAALARLPWFRHGTLPDWLRLRLLDELTPAQLRAVKRTLEALLVTASRGVGEIDDLEIARERKRPLDVLARLILRTESARAPQHHPLRDRVFLSFMRGRRPEPLAMRVPRIFGDMLRARRGPVPPGAAARVRRLARALIAAPLLLLLGGFGGPALWRGVVPIGAQPLEPVATLSMATASAVQPPIAQDDGMREVLAPAPFVPPSTPLLLLIGWNLVVLLGLAWIIYGRSAHAPSAPHSRVALAAGIASGSITGLTAFGGLFVGIVAVGRAMFDRLLGKRRGRVRRVLLVLAAAVLASAVTVFTPLPTIVLGAVVAGQWVTRRVASFGAHRHAEERRMPKQPGALARRAAIALTGTVAALLALSWVNGTRFLRDTRQDVEHLRLALAQPQATIAELDSLRALTSLLGDYSRKEPPLEMLMGMGGVDDLLADARALYFDAFERLLWNDTRDDLSSALAAMPAAGVTYDSAYTALTAYLLTTAETGRSTPAQLTPVLMRFRSLRAASDPVSDAVVGQQFDFFALELPFGNPYPVSADAALVMSVRQYLLGFDDDDRVYHALIAEASRAAPSILLDEMVPLAGGVLRSAFEVPGAFTRTGSTTMQSGLANLERRMPSEDWVLGENRVGAQDPTRLRVAISERYRAEFEAVWLNFLASVSKVPAATAPEFARQMRSLASQQSPLTSLFRLVTQQTAVDSLVAAAFHPVRTLVPAASPEDPGFVSYLDGLEGLAAALESGDRQQVVTAVARVNGEVQALSAAFAAPGSGVAAARSVRSLLEVDLPDAVLAPSDLPAQQFCAAMSQRVAGRYPFDTATYADVSVDDLDFVLGPGGAFDRLIEAFAGTVTYDGAAYRAAPGTALSPTFLDMLTRLRRIRDGLYPSGAQRPGFEYVLQPQLDGGLAEVRFSLNGTEFVASPKQAGQGVVQWPPNGDSDAHLSARLADGTRVTIAQFKGPWSSLRLFSAARWTPTRAPGLFRLTWNVAGTTVHADVRLTQGSAPIEPGFFSDLTCISSVR